MLIYLKNFKQHIVFFCTI